MIKKSRLSDDSLWCGYYLTHYQKEELLVLANKEFEKSKEDRLKPFQLVEIVRQMIRR